MKQIQFSVVLFLSLNLSIFTQSCDQNANWLPKIARVGVPIAAGVATGLYYYLGHPVKIPVEDGVLYWHEQEKITLEKLYTGLIATDDELIRLDPGLVSFSCRDNLDLCVSTKYFINMYRLQKNVPGSAYAQRIPKSRVYRFPQKLVYDSGVAYTREDMLARLQEQQKDIEGWRQERQAKFEAEKKCAQNKQNKYLLTSLGGAALAGLTTFVALSHLTKK